MRIGVEPLKDAVNTAMPPNIFEVKLAVFFNHTKKINFAYVFQLNCLSHHQG